MRIMLLVLAAGIATLSFSAPAQAQFGDETLGPVKKCPPYCPRPIVRPRGGANPAPVDPPGAVHPRPRPHWQPPIYHGDGWQHYNHPRYYYDPYFVSPYIYDSYDDDRFTYDEYYDHIDQPRRAARVSCASANRLLRRNGYRNVKATDCKGKSYGFTASKGGKSYKLTVSARTGSIISRKRY